jgi:sirohydrochlorin ferrochelatase
VTAEPDLVVCGHGTKDAEGRAAVAALVDEVATLVPGVTVREAYVDVHGPAVADVVASVPHRPGSGPSGVVVPALLAAGHHVRVDLAEAVRGRPDVVVAGALGPDDRLVDVLLERMGDAGVRDDADVLLAAAGSSDASARADAAEVARRLAERRGSPVSIAFAVGAEPTVAQSVVRAVHAGRPVAVVSYLLARGHFQRRLEGCGADVVTAPLLPDPRVARVVVDRYRAAVAGGRSGPPDGA